MRAGATHLPHVKIQNLTCAHTMLHAALVCAQVRMYTRAVLEISKIC